MNKWEIERKETRDKLQNSKRLRRKGMRQSKIKDRMNSRLQNSKRLRRKGSETKSKIRQERIMTAASHRLVRKYTQTSEKDSDQNGSHYYIIYIDK